MLINAIAAVFLLFLASHTPAIPVNGKSSAILMVSGERGGIEMIEVTSKYGIRSDARTWILCKRGKATEKNPEGWVAIKYFVSLQALYDALRDILLRTSEYESFADLRKNLRAINVILDKALKVHL